MINFILQAKKPFLIFFLLLLLGSIPLRARPTYDFQFVDGNGNRYVITKEKLISLQYFAITPIMSSSGIYSGGESRSTFINQKQLDAFTSLLSGLEWKKDQETRDRRKGMSHVFWRKKREIKFHSFEMLDEKAEKIENLLKGYLMKVSNQSENDPLLGKKISVTREESPWLGFTNSYEEEEQGKHLKAKPFPMPGYSVFKLPTENSMEAQSFLARNDTHREVIVNERYFSNLERFDVTKLKLGESQFVGIIKDIKVRSAEVLIPFLLKGQILITYWHTDSEVTIERKEIKENEVFYTLSGTHHYYTNEKNSSNFRFKISINQTSGDVFVYGE